MKRTLSVMLSVFWFFTGILHAHDFVVDGIAYNILSPGQVEVTYKGSEVNEAPYVNCTPKVRHKTFEVQFLYETLF
ncbi:MAG: hypothetical protein J6N71_01405 [Muribaculaceae bacterium]|nr:hypothetical protein [Muribaculaceae bacterium]